MSSSEPSSSDFIPPDDDISTPVQQPLLTDDDDDIAFELAAETTDDNATEDEDIVEFIGEPAGRLQSWRSLTAPDADEGEETTTTLTHRELIALLAGDDDEEDEDDEDDDDFHPAVQESSAAEEESQEESRAGDDDVNMENDTRGQIMRSTHLACLAISSPANRSKVTRNHLIRFMRSRGANGFLGHGGIHALFGPDDDEDDDEHNIYPNRRRRTRPTSEFPKVPSDEGRDLMESGIFGTNARQQESYRRKSKLGHHIMRRELGLGSPGRERSINKLAAQVCLLWSSRVSVKRLTEAQGMIPSSRADTVINYDQRCYSGQFSDDGNFFFSCSQDFQVRMYDTSNPYDWKYYKTVMYPFGQWTITDASLSPDNRFLAYSSIRSMVCLASTDPTESSDPHFLDFAHRGLGHFGIWSVRFSGDGRELVAGTSDNSVCAYDVETRQTLLHIDGHDDDVNAVCFGDKSSPHLLYSGSDDATIKVWDRRSMSEKRAAGVFLGHTEGLTYIDSKGDGRYVLSNGKDQTMKLWDLRKMVPTEQADKIDSTRYSIPFDYRFDDYDTSKYYKHPHDCSVVTYRGHSVLKTLIRCHFSPPGSTDSRYVYSASEDGKVYIYNMDATIAGKVDVRKATQANTGRDSGNGYLDFDTGRGASWRACVRDASWHPNAPIIAATSWNGSNMGTGTCTVHSWNDGNNDDEAEPSMGRSVNARLNEERYEDMSRGANMRALRARAMRARARPMDDDDD